MGKFLEGPVWRLILALAPLVVCILVMAVLLSIYNGTEPGTTHRLSEMLMAPTVIAALVFIGRILFGLLQLVFYHRRGGWAFDPDSTAFYGHYGEGFRAPTRKSKPRRRRR